MPLVVVPTPIGNLEDMTVRGLRILREADIIACEDTRHTLKLLNHYEIKKPLISYHKFNETERLETLLKRIREGETVALVSDAGTPGISDPGMILIQAVIEKGLPMDVLPGANALLPAILLSGMGMDSFTFIGFLDGKKEEKKSRLEELRHNAQTLVFSGEPRNGEGAQRLFVCVALREGRLADLARGAEGRDVRQRLGPGAAAALLQSACDERGQLDRLVAAFDPQRPDALRRVDLVAADGNHVRAQ